jgi:hypothetical protein
MKKMVSRKLILWWIIIALLGLISLTNAAAEITVNPLKTKVYNLGDPVTLSGRIVLEQDMRGRFLIQLACDDKITDLLLILYSFR